MRRRVPSALVYLLLAVTAAGAIGAIAITGASPPPAGAAADRSSFSGIAGLAVDLGNGALYVLDRARSAIFRVERGAAGAALLAGTLSAGWNGDEIGRAHV